MKNFKLAYNEVSWSLPFFLTQSFLYLPILKELLSADDFKKAVKYIYGTPFCLWSGGRPLPFEIKNIKNIEKIITNLLDFNVIPSFTFTNTLLTNDDLKDIYCNSLLEIIANSGCHIILSSENLYNYIKEKYPNIKLTASVINFFQRKYTSIEDETIHINELIKKFDKVVIRSEYFINSKDEIKHVLDISKLVILANSTCAMDCAYAKRHYNLISMFSKGEITFNQGFDEFTQNCPKVLHPSIGKNKLTDYDLKRAIKLGIRNFKLQGRQVEFDNMFEILCNNFFDKRVNKKELRRIVDKYCYDRIQNSLDLQLYSVMKQV